jgi:hydrogenase maturation protein HypF
VPTEPLITAEIQAVRVRVIGRVQGLGVRPATVRLATSLELTGSVANTADGVLLELQGSPLNIDRFLTEYAEFLPRGTALKQMDVEAIDLCKRSRFEIVERHDQGTNAAAVPLDRVVCGPCLEEIRSHSERRHAYPFTSCTACGPRYSIVESMPYDRAVTTMRHFVLCTACHAEYSFPDDRRFHAQTIACPRCGPQLQFVANHGQVSIGEQALKAAAAELRAGRIVAVLGLGGYQLLVDATSQAAVRRLRERKRRLSKPFAVLVSSLAEAERLALLNDEERKLLTDPSGPIVVVRRRVEASLAADVAPEFESIGLMLPTTPLHAVLCDQFSLPLVCTSGNREGEPLVYERAKVEGELAGIADAWLHHDRPISRPIDDSVVRVIAGVPCYLRLARGFAPHVLPELPGGLEKQFVACGGEQKGAFALWNGSQAVLGPHLGDMDSAATCERWAEQLESMASLYGITLESAVIVHDRHPNYFTTGWARPFRCRTRVQHHHAHLSAVLFEHQLLEAPCIGLAWDGTGYGDDGSVWGGECMRATCADYQRVGWLRPFPLLGGEKAVREPWRIAVALVYEALGPESAAQLTWPEVTSSQVHKLVAVAVNSRIFSQTSSMGRLFDGVAALALGVTNAEYEGRPAMLLEQACDQTAGGSYPLSWDPVSGQIDWRPLIVAILTERSNGASSGMVAMRFHRAVADLASSLAAAHANLPLVTAGGVFQNLILGELLAERVANRRAGWLRPIVVPPGDGGLAAGQLAVAASRYLQSKERNSPCA